MTEKRYHQVELFSSFMALFYDYLSFSIWNTIHSEMLVSHSKTHPVISDHGKISFQIVLKVNRVKLHMCSFSFHCIEYLILSDLQSLLMPIHTERYFTILTLSLSDRDFMSVLFRRIFFAGVPDERHVLLPNSYRVQVIGSRHVDEIEIEEQTYTHTVLYTFNQDGDIQLGT